MHSEEYALQISYCFAQIACPVLLALRIYVIDIWQENVEMVVSDCNRVSHHMLAVEGNSHQLAQLSLM